MAKLARLTISDAEAEKFTGQLTSIFEHLDKLAEVNTDGIPETSQVNGLEHVTRPDVVIPSFDRDAFLKTSERDHARGMIQVRKSI